MLQLLQQVQYQVGVYNSEIDPEHDVDFPCGCPIHQYQAKKWRRLGVQEAWAKAVMYPGEFSCLHATSLLDIDKLSQPIRRKVLQRQRECSRGYEESI
jgi:hypothetical protein